MGVPMMTIRPLSGKTKRGNKLISVVLPEPEEPTKATVSPLAICKLTCLSAGGASWLYWTETASSSMQKLASFELEFCLELTCASC